HRRSRALHPAHPDRRHHPRRRAVAPLRKERGMTVLVLDCGSSALKATAFAPDGGIVATAQAEYAAVAEHRASPESWWNAAVAAVHDLPPLAFRAIALTGTMENLIPIAADGTP